MAWSTVPPLLGVEVSLFSGLWGPHRGRRCSAARCMCSGAHGKQNGGMALGDLAALHSRFAVREHGAPA